MKDLSLYLVGLGQGFQVEDSFAFLARTVVWVCTLFFHLNKVFTQSVWTVLVVAAAACWLVTAFILYCSHNTVYRFAWRDVIWYLLVETVAVPAQAAAAVAGAAVTGGPEVAAAAALSTAVAACGMRIWVTYEQIVMSEQGFSLRNMEMCIVVVIAASICASEVIVVTVASSRDPMFLKVLAIISVVASWTITIVFVRVQRRHAGIHNNLARIVSVLLVLVAVIPVYVVVTASV